MEVIKTYFKINANLFELFFPLNLAPFPFQANGHYINMDFSASVHNVIMHQKKISIDGGVHVTSCSPAEHSIIDLLY